MAPGRMFLEVMLAVAAVDLSGSFRVLRTRTSCPIQRGRPSTEFWLILAIRNIPPLRGHYCYRAPDTNIEGQTFRESLRLIN